MIAETFRDEARQALPALKSLATLPAGEDGVRAVVGRRFALFPQPPRSDEEWAAWWLDYFDVLADLPESALEAGMAAWVKLPEAEFLPRPGKLRELALMTPNRGARAYERAKKAVELQEPKTYERRELPSLRPVDPPRPHETKQEMVARLMAEFRAQKAVPDEKPPLPPVSAELPEGSSISGELKALVERQRAKENA